MYDYESLINQGKYAEAAKALDKELAKKERPHLYYLRAIVSYKLKNYDYANEMLEHALFMKKNPDYLKLKALVLMETLEFAEAFEVLKELIEQKKDAEAYFLAALCLIFLGDQKSRDYMQLAYLSDKLKTKALINEFYLNFFKNNHFIKEKEKKEIEDKIKKLK